MAIGGARYHGTVLALYRGMARWIIMVSLLSLGVPSDGGWRSWWPQYVSFLDSSYEESEEPCEISDRDLGCSNPLMLSWHERNCR